MLTAKAKGLSDKDQLNKEAVPNARIPVATVVAIQIGFSVVGALLIEIVFNYHGIGRLIWDAVVHRDYPMLQATFFIFTVVLVFTNVIADFLYYYMDPRIRIEGQAKITEKGQSIISRKRPTLTALLLASLIVLDLFALVITPRVILELLLLTVTVTIIVQRRRVIGYLRILFYPYRLANLRFTWRNKKVKLIERLANLLLLFGFFLLSAFVVSVILNIVWFDAGAWGIGINLMIAGLVFRLIGTILERPDRLSSIYEEITANRLGLVGLIVVAIFTGIAVFGDIVAPYDPKQILAGTPFARPTPLPQTMGFTLGVAIVILIIGGTLWFYSKRKGAMKLPVFVRKTGYCLLLTELGVVLGLVSIQKGSIPSLIEALVLALFGALIGVRQVLKNRGLERPQLRQLIPRLSSFSILFVGGSLINFFVYQLLTYQPTGITDFHLLGTDQLGHDLYSGILIGTRITLEIGILATIISISIGLTIGLVSGYYGGRIDSLLMRFTDLFFVIPSFVLMIIVAAVVGPSLTTMLIVIGIFSWATTARIVRGQVLSIKERGYIERIRSVGGGNFYIMTRHVLPAVAPLVVVQTVLLVMNSIFFEISLDFVGLGDPAIVSWGSLLFLAYNQGISLGMDWLVMAPGYAIIIFLVGISFLGFGLDEVTNPRLRRR